jgi:hypothetical protein
MWRPVCYLSLSDRRLQREVVDTLHDQGWAVVTCDSGFHLIQAIAGVILGDHPWLRIGLVVVDDATPGCRGASIVMGLRDLGLRMPVALVARPSDPAVTRLDDPEDRVYVLDPALAVVGIGALARNLRLRGARGSASVDADAELELSASAETPRRPAA